MHECIQQLVLRNHSYSRVQREQSLRLKNGFQNYATPTTSSKTYSLNIKIFMHPFKAIYKTAALPMLVNTWNRWFPVFGSWALGSPIIHKKKVKHFFKAPEIWAWNPPSCRFSHTKFCSLTINIHFFIKTMVTTTSFIET